MVFWSKPHIDMGEHRSKQQLDVIKKIEEMGKNETLVTSLEALEKTLKGSCGSLSCVDGSVYKTPSLTITKSQPPTKKKKSAEKENTAPGAMFKLFQYPLAEEKSSQLKRFFRTEISTTSSSTSSSKINADSYYIPGDCVSMSADEAEEWIGKGLKTAKTKIFKTLFAQSAVDAKSLQINLVRLQLVENGGLSWRQECMSKDHLATLIVVLPVKHKGGKILVRCGEEEWMLDASKRKSTERCSWICFTSDAEYLVESVTSGMQLSMVYHVNGKHTAKSTVTVNKDEEVVRMLDAVSKNFKALSASRVGILLEQKYTPKGFTITNLKGKDRSLFNLLTESKYEVKLTFIRALLCNWGFYDQRDYPNAHKEIQMKDCGDNMLDSEIWETDVTEMHEWGRFQEAQAHKCRQLPWEMPWLGAPSLIKALPSMTRVDRDARPSWSEGLTLAETHRAAALLITLKPGFKDTDDGPFTKFYPVAHPDPRGVSEREDFDWGRAKYYIMCGEPTEEEWEQIERNRQARKDWVHQDL